MKSKVWKGFDRSYCICDSKNRETKLKTAKTGLKTAVK